MQHVRMNHEAEFLVKNVTRSTNTQLHTTMVDEHAVCLVFCILIGILHSFQFTGCPKVVFTPSSPAARNNVRTLTSSFQKFHEKSISYETCFTERETIANQ